MLIITPISSYSISYPETTKEASNPTFTDDMADLHRKTNSGPATSASGTPAFPPPPGIISPPPGMGSPSRNSLPTKPHEPVEKRTNSSTAMKKRTSSPTPSSPGPYRGELINRMSSASMATYGAVGGAASAGEMSPHKSPTGSPVGSPPPWKMGKDRK